MNRIFNLLTLLVFPLLTFAQNPKGLWELINESDYVVIGNILSIDTLLPERNDHFEWRRNRAYVEVDKIEKGSIDKKSLELFYYAGAAHKYSANPEVKEKYIMFLKYSKQHQSYILPSERFSLVKFSPSNKNKIIKTISDIISKPEMSLCEYFDLLIKNINEPIAPINRALLNFSMNYDSLDSKLCIDSLDRHKLFNSFRKTKNLTILPFLGDHYSKQIDELLQYEIHQQLKIITVSKEMYCIEETLYTINCLNEISYLKSKQAKSEIEKLDKHIWMGEHEKFATNAKKLLSKYER